MDKTKSLSAVALALGLGTACCARAEVLAMPMATPEVIVTSQPSALPAKGMSMAAVSRAFGSPARRHPAAGGDSPRHPPITRWDYAGFSVFFEHDHVVDVVMPQAPAPIARRDGLTTP